MSIDLLFGNMKMKLDLADNVTSINLDGDGGFCPRTIGPEQWTPPPWWLLGWPFWRTQSPATGEIRLRAPEEISFPSTLL